MYSKFTDMQCSLSLNDITKKEPQFLDICRFRMFVLTRDKKHVFDILNKI